MNEIPVVVVIDDDNEDCSDDKVPSDQSNDNDLASEGGQQRLFALSQEKQDAVRTFMEIMDLKEECVAIREMEKYEYDVQRAMDGFLTSSSSAAQPPTNLSRDSIANKIISFKEPSSNSQPAMANMLSTRVSKPFVDSDFPPNSSSLDGRKTKEMLQQVGGSAGASNKTVTRCYCGWVASAKTVQSEGPNYGRFYLSCGKKARSSRQQRSRVVDPTPNDATTETFTTTTTTKTTSSPVKNPYKKAINQSTKGDKLPPSQSVDNINNVIQYCHFFQWDTVDGSLGSTCCGYNLKSWSGKFSWHWFTPWATLPLDQSRSASVASLPNDRDDSENCWFRPEHVRQGAVGNCWFLSALAVVAEHPYLLEQILRPSPNTLTTSSNMELSCESQVASVKSTFAWMVNGLPLWLTPIYQSLH